MKRARDSHTSSERDLVGQKLRVIEGDEWREGWVLNYDPKHGLLVEYSAEETWWESLEDLQVSLRNTSMRFL